jgi:hypothetical protein
MPRPTERGDGGKDPNHLQPRYYKGRVVGLVVVSVVVGLVVVVVELVVAAVVV